ncbi:MAG TPA: AraC family transcriptional regulator [Chryseolinea sp.]|nr:AraC family transcriptional regulator [Chryseolinea sp.]
MTANLTSINTETSNPVTEIFSSDSYWAGFKIKRTIRSSMYVPERTLSNHTLQFNFGTPISLSWKSKGKWTSGIFDSGNLVELLSQGDKEELQWEGDYNALEIEFTPSFIDGLLEKENVRFREEHNVYDPLLKDIVVKLYEGAHASHLEKLYTESLGIACAIHLGTTYTLGTKRMFAPKGKLSSHQLKNVVDLVHSCINGVITLEDLAQSIHLSVFHFSRLFKNTVGVSPYQFVLRLKIEYAKMLIKRKQSISEIAYTLGFTDSAHFCNAFKKFTGLSPLQFNIAS